MAYDAARREREKKYDKIREEYHATKAGHKKIDADNLEINQDKIFPKDRVNCPMFEECLFDFGCRAFDPKYLKCQNCTLNQTGDVCSNKALHNEATFGALTERPVLTIPKTKGE